MDKRPRDGQFYMRGDEGACGGHNGRPLGLRPRARAPTWCRAASGWLRSLMVKVDFDYLRLAAKALEETQDISLHHFFNSRDIRMIRLVFHFVLPK